MKFLDTPGLDDCIRITIGTPEQNARVRDAFEAVVQNFSRTHVEVSTAGR